MRKEIPNFLYRGDSDLKDKRLLKNTLHHYQLQTNLINGGDGREINEKPLLELINKHVDIGWENTHFLSFSENKETAIRFGINCEIEDVESRFSEYNEYFDYEREWDFALITVDTNKISFKKVGQGIYEGYYKPTLTEFRNYIQYKIFLLNVVECLDGFLGYDKSKYNAKRDEEWLILPATCKQLNIGIENSAILDGGIISEIQTYIKN